MTPDEAIAEWTADITNVTALVAERQKLNEAVVFLGKAGSTVTFMVTGPTPSDKANVPIVEPLPAGAQGVVVEACQARLAEIAKELAALGIDG